ncbi:MAG: hypothetical protein D6706_17465, partial [Chloroflexi bacterium]
MNMSDLSRLTQAKGAVENIAERIGWGCLDVVGATSLLYLAAASGVYVWFANNISKTDAAALTMGTCVGLPALATGAAVGLAAKKLTDNNNNNENES